MASVAPLLRLECLLHRAQLSNTHRLLLLPAGLTNWFREGSHLSLVRHAVRVEENPIHVKNLAIPSATLGRYLSLQYFLCLRFDISMYNLQAVASRLSVAQVAGMAACKGADQCGVLPLSAKSWFRCKSLSGASTWSIVGTVPAILF